MMEGKKYYIQYKPYIVLILKDRAITRRLYKDDKQAQTGVIRLHNKEIAVKYHY